MQLLEELLKSIEVNSIKSLIDFWLARKASLNLGGLFIEVCTQTLQLLLKGKLFGTDDLAIIARNLAANSARPLNLSASSSPNDLAGQIGAANAGWESIAMALTVAGRATADIPFFPPLYTCHTEMRNYQRSLADLADKCLEIALSLDSMNEIQLICQYENFILRSVVDGDQSELAPANLNLDTDCNQGYNVWRRLGDVIGSLMFLGLNETIADQPTIPTFFTELRRSIFAQIYSDDKNMAVFLGRPPRLNRKFCCFQLPSTARDRRHASYVLQSPMANAEYAFFGPGDRAEYVTGLCWTACCASLKEEILEALQEYPDQSEDAGHRFA